MRYRFIRMHQNEYPITLMCRVLQVSRSGYYVWRRRPFSKRDEENRVLMERIKTIHQQSQRTYGSPRMHKQLRQEGYVCGENRVRRLMQVHGIRAKQKRRFRITTDSNHTHPVVENRLRRNFNAVKPNDGWVSDITYIKTEEGWLYLAVVMDLFSRRIVGWSMQKTLSQQLTLDALHMAIQQRNPSGELLHHSDQGVQYACTAYQNVLKQFNIDCSMSRKGNCWDNAPIESFFGTLKTELVHHESFQTRQQAKRAIFEYIEVFYNRKRLHSSLGYYSPVNFERLHSLN